MADVSVTCGDSRASVLIDDVALEDETDGHEATERDYEDSGSCHETTAQTEGEERLHYSAKGTEENQ